MGLLVGFLLVPSIAGTLGFIIKAQLKIFNRQCRIFYIIRCKNNHG